jgi:peptidoglycan-associated lipoprotein
MKHARPLALLSAVLCLSIAVSGCKKKPEGITPLPGRTSPPPVAGDDAGRPKLPDTPIVIDQGTRPVPTPPSEFGTPPTDADFSKWSRDADIFKSETIYFDFDKSNIRPDQTEKLDRLFTKMQGMPGKALRIEGNCDERGTEEYNRALGERRALAAREYLVRKGMNPAMIETISFGKNNPVDPGHNDAAWAKNRRDDFVLLSPPGAGM